MFIRSSKFIKGFTTTEMLIVVAVLAIVAGLTFPFYQKTRDEGSLDSTVWRFSSILRQAQFRSMAVDGGVAWGVAQNGAQATLFQGDSYAARDPLKDEIFIPDDGMVLGGDSEVVFSLIDGQPSTLAVFSVSSDQGAINLSLNEKGVIEF